MQKTIKLGKIDYLEIGRKTCPVEVELELRDTKQGLEFSVCGTIWNHKHTDCYSAGQNLDTIAKYIKTKEFKEIYKFWKNYHLNGMHAGTIKQEEALHKAKLENWANDYEECCEYLESIGLLEDNGYKFGTDWLYKDIPEKDLNRIKELLK